MFKERKIHTKLYKTYQLSTSHFSELLLSVSLIFYERSECEDRIQLSAHGSLQISGS